METSKDNVYKKTNFADWDSLDIIKGFDFSKSNKIDEIIKSYGFNGI